jgi:hypothetical protein
MVEKFLPVLSNVKDEGTAEEEVLESKTSRNPTIVEEILELTVRLERYFRSSRSS